MHHQFTDGTIVKQGSTWQLGGGLALDETIDGLPMISSSMNVYSVADFHAFANGTDYTTEVQDAIDAAAGPGGIVLLPSASGNYVVSGPLVIPDGVKLVGLEGSKLVSSATNAPLFSIVGSEVAIEGLRLIGPQMTVQHASSRAFDINGASAASPVTSLKIRRCHLSAFGMYGIFGEFVDGFEISDNIIEDINYGAIVGLSMLNGKITGNRIRNVTNTAGPPYNAYGIGLSRRGAQNSLTTYPRSSDVVVSENIIKDIPIWEALDTHGGERISFIDNKTYNCKYAIGINSATNATIAAFAPIDCHAIGNQCDSGVTDGSRNYGIIFSGAFSATPGVPTEAGTGSIIGNIVRGYGLESDNTSGSGAIFCYATRGLGVHNNELIEPAGVGINFYNENFGFSCTGNTTTDPWSDTSTDCPTIYVGSQYNQGYVGAGNVLVRGTLTGHTYITTRGLSVTADATNRCVLGTNAFAPASEYEVFGVRGFIQSPSTYGVGNDRGDADCTITEGVDERVVVYATTLTANRTVTLTAAKRPGAEVLLNRYGSSGGAFDVIFAGQHFPTNSWGLAAWTGSAWQIIKCGSMITALSASIPAPPVAASTYTQADIQLMVDAINNLRSAVIGRLSR